MASIASNVIWGSGPIIPFDFSYEKKREGSTQYYQITVSCGTITGDSRFGYPIYVQIFLDGVVKTSYTLKNASPSQWTSALSNTSGWLSVSNKTSGTTALSIRIYSGLGSSRDTTYTFSLDIDPAASTISCTSANIGQKPTITINRASPNFVHTLNCYLDNRVEIIAERTSATSITNWTIPEWLYAKIPNSKTGEATLHCATYDGSATDALGVTACKLSFGTNETVCKPSVSGTVVDTNAKTIAVTGDASKYLVRYMSNALCTISTSLNKNAGSIKAKTINNTAVTGNTLEIPNVETGVFEFWAKDSREYPNSDKVTKTLIPYVKLTANVTGQRTDPTSGNATITIKGNYFAGNFGKQDNTLSVKYRYGGKDYITLTPTINKTKNEYSVSVSFSEIEYTKAVTFEVVVEDALETITKYVTIPKGIPVFDWGENDFKFNVPVLFGGGQALFSTRANVFNGDANDVKYNAVLTVAESGATNVPTLNGFLIAFSPMPDIVFQINCRYDGKDLKFRTCWWGTWYEWKAFT